MPVVTKKKIKKGDNMPGQRGGKKKKKQRGGK